METAETAETNRRARLYEYPEFELEAHFDMDFAPSRLVLCSTDRGGRLDTEWITCAADSAVSFEAVR